MPSGSAGRRRDSFDEVAELYDQARPEYPRELVNDLATLVGLGEGCRVLEIGPGTGQLTVRLSDRGAFVTGVELGGNMAAVARRNLARFPHAEIVVADFDTWELPAEPFDLVVAATAFHWLDPDTRLEKCARALRPGGLLAIIETHWGVSDDEDRFGVESQSCYARWDPDYDPAFRPPTFACLPERYSDLEDSSHFAPGAHQRYRCDRAYDASQYCGLLATFSNLLAFDEYTRQGFLQCMAGLISNRFDGRIVRHDVYDLWLAQKRYQPRATSASSGK